MLSQFEPANVDRLGQRLLAANLEGTFTLDATRDKAFVALHRSQPHAAHHSYIFARKLFSGTRTLKKLDVAVDAYLATLRPRLFDEKEDEGAD